MGKKVLMIIGNGFTIDLLNHIEINGTINVVNLFKEGDKVPWPVDNEPGFLSYKYTPHLWQIGANVTLDKEKSVDIIEDIITTANMYTEIKKNHANIEPTALNSIKDRRYIKAYRELTSYLKHLFVYYNQLLDDEEIMPSKLCDWGWYKYLCKLNEDQTIEEITIVTYNYDIFLERMLMLTGIKFNILGIDEETEKIKIIKPHGSISYSHKTILPIEVYKINYEQIFPEAKISDFEVRYSDLNFNHLVDAIIPPAGNSSRIDVEWAKVLRQLAVNKAGNLSFADEVVICGLSYWHVDRQEIDELLANIHPSANVKMVNPNVPQTFSAVLESIFGNYIAYSSSIMLGR